MGKAIVKNGTDECMKALGLTTDEEFKEVFLKPLAIINQNNFYHIQLIEDEMTYYNNEGTINYTTKFVPNAPLPSDDELIYETEEELEEMKKELAESQKTPGTLKDIVIYLEMDDGVYTDEAGKEYHKINALGYSVSEGLLYTPWSVNKAIEVKDPYFIEDNKD